MGHDRQSSPSADGNEADVDFVVVDVETACSRASSICQIGIVGFRNGAEVFEYETLVDPCDDFSPFYTRIHGIKPHHVAGQPNFAAVYAIINQHLAARITVAHSFFDKGALGAACRVHGRPPIETKWLDSVRVAKRAWPHLSSHRLNVLSGYLGIRHKHHNALSDARAAGLVIVKAIEHTGIELSGWLKPVNPRGGKAPAPAKEGPLTGQRIAILGAARDGALGTWLAAAGARVAASVGVTSTMLVVSHDQPFGRYAHAAPAYQRALELQQDGSSIEIIAEEDLRQRIDRAQAAVHA